MIRTTVFFMLTLAVLGGSIGCSSGGGRAVNYVYHSEQDPVTNEAAHITRGEMPSAESFTGSYHSPQIGDVFLEQTGETVIGTYEYDRAACHATGRFEGRVSGNLLRFTWTESQAECGRMQPLTGHGYFLFWKDSAENGRINGEWGVGEDENGGGPWSATRDRVRRQPQRRTGSSSGGSVFEDANGTPPASGTSSSGTSTTP
jgi:hypothetical protein